MTVKNTDIILQNKVFLWIALATALILLIPVLGQWPWTLSDFVVMGTLIFGTGSIFVLWARKTRKYRIVIGIALLIAFLLIWAELAVGLFRTPFAGS